MDTKLIREWGSDILSYRLRTTRNKKRAQHEDFQKRLIQLDKEENKLYAQRRKLGWELLKPPVQKGWKRTFVLRADVARSKQGAFYAGILAKINTKQYDHRKDFLKKKRAFGKKKYVPREQYLLQPEEWQFQKLGFSETEKQQFHEEYAYLKGRDIFIKRHVFNEPWRFVLKVQPNMIDKIRKKDPEIDARLHEINSYLERNALRRVLGRLKDTNYAWWKNKGDKHTEVSGFKNKPIARILDELKEE